MKHVDDHVELSGEEASGGVTGHGVRYVLIGGILLAVIALSAVWITGALSN